MTTFEWVTVALGTLGFLTTWICMLIGGIRWVEGIKMDVAKKVLKERQETDRSLSAAQDGFDADQKTQDNRFGEGVAAVRQHIVDVEKKVYQVELYGRDHYPEKDEVREIRDDIKEMRAEIKADLRDIIAKIDSRH